MNNNDRIKRLRYALDIKDNDMIEIFKLGHVEVTKDEFLSMLRKVNDEDYELELADEQFERFLNGMIISQRGVKDGPEQPLELHPGNANNVMLKKLKIALSYTTEDMIDTLDDANIIVSKSQMGSFLRKEGHRNYEPCGDNYARNFLKGLMTNYRK